MTHTGAPEQRPFEPTRPNPFATRFVKPGLVPPLDAGGRSLPLRPLVDRLRPGTCFVIEGQHGRGKTNLVRSLLAAAAAEGHEPRFLQIRSSRDAWSAVVALVTVRPRSLLAIDGWERIPRPLAWGVPMLARWRGLAVLTTSHGPCGLPVLARCESSPAQFAAIVAALPDGRDLIAAADIDSAYERHRGNLRDALGELYDRFEERAARPGRGGVCGSCGPQRS